MSTPLAWLRVLSVNRWKQAAFVYLLFRNDKSLVVRSVTANASFGLLPSASSLHLFNACLNAVHHDFKGEARLTLRL